MWYCHLWNRTLTCSYLYQWTSLSSLFNCVCITKFFCENGILVVIQELEIVSLVFPGRQDLPENASSVLLHKLSLKQSTLKI